MDLIRNFYVGQKFSIGNFQIEIVSYAGVTLIRGKNRVAEMQLYKIKLNNEERYASDSGLIANDASIFNKVIANTGYRGNVDINMYKTEYSMWKDMLYHCCYMSNKLYPYYGGIGITVDPKWFCFELFLYDFVNVYGYDKIRNNKCTYVIDIKTKQKNIPESSRVYAPGKISIKQYYQSDVYDNTEKAKSIGADQNAGLYLDSVPANIVNNTIKYNQLPNGDYPQKAYEAVTQNPPNLKIPDNDDLGINTIRTFNGVHYHNASSIIPIQKKKS